MEDEYINIEDLLKENANIYQIQINNDSLIIKHIGTGSESPEIIIKEGFGIDNSLNLYNCIYKEKEFNNINDIFFPIIKLKKKEEYYTIIIKLNTIKYNLIINDFQLYFTYSNDNNVFNYYEIKKNINSSNIIETILENVINVGIKII